MKRAVKAEPRMWGSSIVGSATILQERQRPRERLVSGRLFSRKAALTLYIYGGFDLHESLMAKLGKHKKSGSCLHIKRLADVDQAVLEALVSASVNTLKRRPGSDAAASAHALPSEAP